MSLTAKEALLTLRSPEATMPITCLIIFVCLWGPGLGGAPDASHAANVSIQVTEGSGVGKLKEPAVDHEKFELTKQSSQDAIMLTFQFKLTENTDVKWETILWKSKLYVQVPCVILPDGSKEA
ncbi:uncharacterized protein LOC106473529 [Limulus polyphemus]|uniref:Uncharacterized protein LOC106473529 n=1 Tax=Limulus polyphemus TaxID=6850 RepID=A0ABM1BVU6_LIMPO|nr:uncharacterized protein LOC106473529 [Limulus polyphemus]